MAGAMGLTAVAAGIPLAVDGFTLSDLGARQVASGFEAAASTVADRVAERLAVVGVTLDAVANGPAPNATGIDEATALARVLSGMRGRTPAAMALYVAGPDGGYALARAMGPEGMDRAGAAGARGAAWELQVGEPCGPRLCDGFAWLDTAFRVTGRRPAMPVDYDSRARPWYASALASDTIVTSPPYRFQDVDAIGLTMSRRSGDEVYGVDLTLDGLGATLGGAMVPGDMRLALLAEGGWLVADTGGTRVPARVEARTRGDVPSWIADAATRGHGADGRAPGHDGETLVMHRSLPLDGVRLDLVGGMPGRILDAPVRRRMMAGVAFEAVMLALALTLALAAAVSVSRPMADLAREVEAVVGFRAAEVQRRPSRLREVLRLGAAVDTLELSLRAFSTYLPPRLVRSIVERGALPALGGERREVVVLFTDVEGFTALSDSVAPAVLSDQLSRHLGAIARSVMDCGGTVDKFIGDSVMAFWDGGPADSASACEAVLLAIARTAALDAEFAAEGLDPIASRFGLHRGEAVVGSVGTPGRMNYTVFGRTVNVASRIEALNKRTNTRALASDAVVAAAGAGFAFRGLGPMAVRGCAEPVGVNEMLGIAPT